MAEDASVGYGALMENMNVETLRAGAHQLHGYCHYCDRWTLLELEEMLLQWQDLQHVPSVVQCEDCGEFGILKVRTKLAPPGELQQALLQDGSLAG